MTERDNNIENLLGLTEYPSSSEEENNAPRPTATQGWQQQQPNPAQTSRDPDEVINLDESPSPNASSSAEQVDSTPPTAPVDPRREQAWLDHQLFWSSIGNPQRVNRWNFRPSGTSGLMSRAMPQSHGVPTDPRPGAHEARLFGHRPAVAQFRTPVADLRLMVHQPVPELSQPQLPPSASADMLSIMAFRRLQRYRTYRRNRAASLGLLSRLPPLAQPRESSPRAPSRATRPAPPAAHELHALHAPHAAHAPHAPLVMPVDRLVSSMHNYLGGGEGAAGARPPDDGAQNDVGDNDNDQSGDDAESGRLSPRLPVPEEEPPDNSDNMEVDEGNVRSPAAERADEGGEEEGEGEEESEGESGAAASPPPADDIPNESGNATRRIFIGVRRRSRTNKRKRDAERQRAEDFNVKEFNQNLLRLLECPVCLEWMEPPMLQCRLGHLVCARCRARLSTCPVCRSGFSSVRNRAMEGVAELLRYPCRHGCGREARLRRRAAHEASCPCRRYRCPAHSCAERAPQPYDELVRHVQRNHAAMIKTGRLHKFSVKVNAQQHDNWLIMAGFGLFHLRIAVDIRTWSILAYVAYIGPKCRAKEFTYEVTVIGQHNGRKLVYTRATHSDLESSSLNVSRQDCFHITLDEAINFLRFRNRHCQPDRLLDFTVEITKQDVIIADNNSVVSDD